MKRAVLALAALSVMACSTSGPYVWVDELPDASAPAPPYKIQAGDHLIVNVWNQPPLSGEVLVRPDGNLTLPLVGDIQVQGMTPSEASGVIAKRLVETKLITDPYVAVSLAGGHEATVNVLGEVREGGSFKLRGGEGVLELIARAGGLSEFADKDRIFVVRKRDNQKIRFTFDKLARADGPGAAFKLQDGDTVIVE